MADLKISQLPALASAFVAAGDQLPIVDTSASETKRVGADELVSAGIRLMPSAGIPWAKIDPTGLIIPDGSVSTVKVVDGAITTPKIVDGAVTDAKITGPISLSKLGNQAANVVLAGPATGTAAAAPTFRALIGTDLPIATTTTRGAVIVDGGSGIVVDANGVVALTTTVTAGTSPVVTYNDKGRITAGRALQPSDLPIATASAVGAVRIGTGLGVTAAGVLSVSLTTAQIPDLDASKITSGTFPSARIANQAITNLKLADYSVGFIQEAQPSSAPGAQHIGTLWFQESTAKLSMWNGNSWMPVGQGALSSENLRFCGTFDAALGQVKAVTQFGTSEGLTPGSAVPPATNQLTGVYLVCDTPGTFDGKTFDAGDWVLCMGQARGWERIDTLSSGGGGGGGTLDSLTDVTITFPATGDVLVYNGTNWVNGPMPDPGTY